MSALASCPSEITLERLFVGELAFEQKRELERHTASCESCARFLRARREGFAAFPALDSEALLARVQAHAPLRAPEPKPARLWLAAFSSLLALAAIALVLLPSADELAATRTKGALNLRVYRLRDGQSEEVPSGTRFRPGDRLRFRVSTPSQGYVSIVGVEADGTPYTAWPLGNERGNPLAPSQDQLLPGAVELDDALGEETLWLVHCASPVACKVVASGLECPAGCSKTPFRLDKPR